MNPIPNSINLDNQLSKKSEMNTQINDKYKTERCRHYETHGHCALGEKCHFAHGDEELRKPNDPINPEQYNHANKLQ